MEKDLLFGLLTKAYTRSEQELTDLLYKKTDDSDEMILRDDALDLLLDIDVQRVQNIQANTKPDKKILDDQYSRGKRETMEGFEKEVREKYSLDSEKTGIELIDEVITSQTKQTKPKEITVEDVKKHPAYLELEQNSVPKTKHDELQKEYDNFKQDRDKSEKLTKVQEFVLKEFELLKPVHSENPEVRINRQKDFLAKFSQWDYQLQDGNDPLILDENGNRLEDGHGNPVSWKDFVKKNASLYYDFKKQNGKPGSGNDGDGDPIEIQVPKSVEEYTQMVLNETDPAKRIKIQEAAKAAGLDI